ncbi:MAG: alpha/beta fold hydrolase [Segniliparus sp.]|uniref:alpha/beta fold hydrolase n=1 Tax=Segniliparus sp. TaxID=2804064 RepID=UPI003F34F6F5
MVDIPANIRIGEASLEVGRFASLAGFERFVAAYRRGLAAMEAPARTFDLSTAYGSVRVYRFGDDSGVPVVLIPGRNASTPLWRANLAPLRALGRRVYALDLLGEAGLSAQEAPVRSDHDQALWLEQALAGLGAADAAPYGPGFAKAHVLGVSIGGWAAVNHALRFPARVASLVLLDPAMTFAPVTWKMLVVSLGSVAPMPQRVRMRLLRWVSGGAEVDESLPEAALVASGMRDFQMRLPAPKPFSEERLGQLAVPTLVLLAGRSIVHDPCRAAARARSALPNGQVELWPEASHAINGEFPERIASLAGAFWAAAEP